MGRYRAASGRGGGGGGGGEALTFEPSHRCWSLHLELVKGGKGGGEKSFHFMIF